MLREKAMFDKSVAAVKFVIDRHQQESSGR